MDNPRITDPELELKLSLELIPLARAMLGEDISTARKINPAWCLRPTSAQAYAKLAKIPDDAIMPTFLDLGASDRYMKEAMAEVHTSSSTQGIVDKMREWWQKRTETAWLKKLVDAPTAKEKQQWAAAIGRLYKEDRSGVYVVDMANPSDPEEHLMVYQEIEYRPRGDLAVLKAKKKSGKSTFLKIEVACMISESGKVLGMSRTCIPGTDTIRPPYDVLWLDTEQSYASSDKCYRQVLQLAGLPLNINSPHLRMVNLRMKNPDERLKRLEDEVSEGHYDVVVLDGIKDVAKDINDPTETDMIVCKILQILQDTKVAFVAVIHENPSKESDKMRGWLGTEIGNKAFEIQDVKHNQETGVFSVTNPDRREKTIPAYGFKFDEDDMLEECLPEANGNGQVTNLGPGSGPQSLTKEEKQWLQFSKAYESDFNLSMTQEEIIQKLLLIGMSETTIKRRLKLFEVKKKIIRYEIDGTSRYGLSLSEKAKLQSRLEGTAEEQDSDVPF